jgi:hypothetical protein
VTDATLLLLPTKIRVGQHIAQHSRHTVENDPRFRASVSYDYYTPKLHPQAVSRSKKRVEAFCVIANFPSPNGRISIDVVNRHRVAMPDVKSEKFAIGRHIIGKQLYPM